MTPACPRPLVALCAVLMLGFSACSADNATSSAEGPGENPPAVVGDPARRADYEAAAEHARQWLVSQGDAIPAYMPLVLDYLRRRFGAEGVEPLLDVSRGAVDDPQFGAAARVYLRLADPGVQITPQMLAALTDEVDVVTGPALACAGIPLPPDYIETLDQSAREGRYGLTHAVLALEWAREQGCVSEAEARPRLDGWADLLVVLLEERQAQPEGFLATDLSIEAMAMLDYAGRPDRIRPEWFGAVLAAQHPDGSFPRTQGQPDSNPHATTLAYWVLLAAAHPDAARLPWVPPSP